MSKKAQEKQQIDPNPDASPLHEETSLDRVFDEPHPPGAEIITRETFFEDLPFSENPSALISSFMQQAHLGEALQVYIDGLKSQKFSARKQSADKILDLALKQPDTPSGVNINFSFGGKFNEKPEISVGSSIITGEDERLGKG